MTVPFLQGYWKQQCHPELTSKVLALYQECWPGISKIPISHHSCPHLQANLCSLWDQSLWQRLQSNYGQFSIFGLESQTVLEYSEWYKNWRSPYKIWKKTKNTWMCRTWRKVLVYFWLKKKGGVGHQKCTRSSQTRGWNERDTYAIAPLKQKLCFVSVCIVCNCWMMIMGRVMLSLCLHYLTQLLSTWCLFMPSALMEAESG